MTPDKATALREAAERATPGNWMLSGVRDTHPFSAHKILAGEKQEAIALVFFDKRTGLGFADAKFIALADPPTIIALLAERERLRGALESIRDIAGAPSDRDPDYSRLDRIDATARQALEATHDQ